VDNKKLDLTKVDDVKKFLADLKSNNKDPKARDGGPTPLKDPTIGGSGKKGDDKDSTLAKIFNRWYSYVAYVGLAVASGLGIWYFWPNKTKKTDYKKVGLYTGGGLGLLAACGGGGYLFCGNGPKKGGKKDATNRSISNRGNGNQTNSKGENDDESEGELPVLWIVTVVIVIVVIVCVAVCCFCPTEEESEYPPLPADPQPEDLV